MAGEQGAPGGGLPEELLFAALTALGLMLKMCARCIPGPPPFPFIFGRLSPKPFFGGGLLVQAL